MQEISLLPGDMGVSPIFIKSPKTGGYRGLKEIATSFRIFLTGKDSQ